MSRIHLATATNSSKEVRIVFDSEWGEYQCIPVWISSACKRADRTYHTSDMQDAIDTAKKMATIDGSQYMTDTAYSELPAMAKHITKREN